MTHALRDGLRDLVSDPVLPRSLAERVRATHARRRRRLAVTGAVATGTAVAAVALAVPGGKREPVPPAAGPLLAGNGAVVSTPDAPLRFCQERSRQAVAPPPPPDCFLAVEVSGLRWEDLAGDATERGAVRWKYAWLAGTYRDGTLHVTEHGPRRYPAGGPAPRRNPCDASPAPGRGHPDPVVALERWREANPGVVVLTDVRSSRSGGDAVVAVTHDADYVRGALQHSFGPALCVVASRYTAAEIGAAYSDARTMSPGWPDTTLEVGPLDGQPYVKVHVRLLDEAVRALVARHPDGLVVPQPWLAPPAAKALARPRRSPLPIGEQP